jgi:hypothetical protein
MTQHDAQYLCDLTRALWNSHVWRLRLNIQHSFEQGTSPELYSPRTSMSSVLISTNRWPFRRGFGNPSGSGLSGSSSAIAVCDCNMAQGSWEPWGFDFQDSRRTTEFDRKLAETPDLFLTTNAH